MNQNETKISADNQVIKSDEPCILATCLQKAKQKDLEAKKKLKAEKVAEQSAKRKEGSTTANAPPAKRQSTGDDLPHSFNSSAINKSLLNLTSTQMFLRLSHE